MKRVGRRGSGVSCPSATARLKTTLSSRPSQLRRLLKASAYFGIIDLADLVCSALAQKISRGGYVYGGAGSLFGIAKDASPDDFVGEDCAVVLGQFTEVEAAPPNVEVDLWSSVLEPLALPYPLMAKCDVFLARNVARLGQAASDLISCSAYSVAESEVAFAARLLRHPMVRGCLADNVRMDVVLHFSEACLRNRALHEFLGLFTAEIPDYSTKPIDSERLEMLADNPRSASVLLEHIAVGARFELHIEGRTLDLAAWSNFAGDFEKIFSLVWCPP
jgi:hypothetical protein